MRMRARVPAATMLLVALAIASPAAASLAVHPVDFSVSEDSSSLPRSLRYGVLLCKFLDKPLEPRPPSDYETIMAPTQPGLAHYWHDVSYGRFELNSEVSGWHVLPGLHSQYVPEYSSPRYWELARDCLAAAVGLDQSKFDGFIFVFNERLRSAAYTTLLRYAFIEDPDGTEDLRGVIAHELGHTFRFAHSDRPEGRGASYWDVMGPIQGCEKDICPPIHPIAEWKRRARWIRPIEVLQPRPGTTTTVKLAPASAPPLPSGQRRMALVRIRGSRSTYYTVEVRRRRGYDARLAGEGVLIHRFRPLFVGNPEVVHQPKKREALDVMYESWGTGETFVDDHHGIEIRVGERVKDGSYLISVTSPKVRQRTVWRRAKFAIYAADDLPRADRHRTIYADLRVSSPPWADRCYASAPVIPQRRVGEEWESLAPVETGPDGTWQRAFAMEEAGAENTLYRVILPRRVTKWNVCPRRVSKAVRRED